MIETNDDLLIEAVNEISIRQDLVGTALGKHPADTALRVGRLLDVHTRTWREDQEVIIKGRRIAWIGPAGKYPGEVRQRVDKRHLSAVPGSHTGVGGSLGPPARQYVDLRSKSRIFQCGWI